MFLFLFRIYAFLIPIVWWKTSFLFVRIDIQECLIQIKNQVFFRSFLFITDIVFILLSLYRCWFQLYPSFFGICPWFIFFLFCLYWQFTFSLVNRPLYAESVESHWLRNILNHSMGLCYQSSGRAIYCYNCYDSYISISMVVGYLSISKIFLSYS
jgi:hypothetical protein